VPGHTPGEKLKNNPKKKRNNKKASSKRISKTIRRERNKGTKPNKAIAIGLSVERQRKRKRPTFE